MSNYIIDPVRSITGDIVEKLEFIGKDRYSSFNILEDNNSITTFKSTLEEFVFPEKIKLFSNDIYNDSITENSRWILKENDLASFSLSQDDRDRNMAILMNIYDYVPQIINKHVIDISEYDNNFDTYNNSCLNACNYLVTKLYDYLSWTFTLTDKLIWIYLMLACKYEQRAIKYILKSPIYGRNADIIKYKCRFGLSPIILACRSDNITAIKYFVEYGYITINDLININYENLPALYYCFLHESTLSYIINTFGKEILFLNTFDNISPIHFIFSYSQSSTNYLINNGLISKNMLQQYVDNISPIMLLGMYNPDKIFDLIESDICTYDDLSYISNTYGNIMNILAMYNPDKLIKLIEYDIIDSKLFESKTQCICINDNDIIISVPLIFLLVENADILRQLICSDAFVNYNMLSTEFYDTDIFSEIICNTPPMLGPILHIVNNTIGIKDIDISNILAYCLRYDPKLAFEILNMDIDESVILNKDNNGLNVLMYILKFGENYLGDLFDSILNIIFSKFLSDNLIEDKDNNNVNTMVYMFKYHPDISYEMLNKYKLFNIAHICDVLAVCPDINISKIIIDDYRSAITKEHIDIFLLIQHNHTVLDYMLSIECIDNEMFNTRKYGNNILSFAIKNNVSNIILIKIIDYKLFSKELFEERDRLGNTPLIIAIYKNYNYARIILNSKLLTDDVYNLKDNNGRNSYTIACHANNDIKTLNLIRKSLFFKDSMFTELDNLGNTPLYYAIENSNIIAEYVLSDQLCTKDIYYNAISKYVIDGNLDKIEHNMNMILDNEYCDNEILKLLFFPILEKGNYPSNNVDNMFKKISSADIIFQYNRNGDNCFHVAINNMNYDIAEFMLRQKFNCYKLIEYENNKGITPLHMLIDNNQYNMILYYAVICNKHGEYQRVYDILSIDWKGIPLFLHLVSVMDNIELLLSLEKNLIKRIIKEIVDENNRNCLYYLGNSEDIHISEKQEYIYILLKGEYIDKSVINNKDNIDGSSFLFECPYLADIILTYRDLCLPEQEDLCSSELFSYENNLGINLLHVLLTTHNYAIVKCLLDSDYVDEHLLTDKNLSLIIDLNDISIDILLESGICDVSVVNRKINGIPILHLALQRNRDYVSQKLLSSKYDLSESYNFVDTYENNILINTTHLSYDIFVQLIESKYFSKELLVKNNIYGNNCISNFIKYSPDSLKYIFENNYWDDNVINNRDINGNTIIMYCSNNKEILEYLLNIDGMNELLYKVNNMNENCLHIFIDAPYDCVKLVLDNSDIYKLLIQQDNYGNTFLHKLLLSNNNDYIDKIINDYDISQDILSIVNNNGQTILMLMVESRLDCVKLLNNADDKALYIKDNSGNNLLMYAAKYSSDIIEGIIERAGSNILAERNIAFETPLMYASYYSVRSVDIILKNESTSIEHMYCGHTNHKSIMTIAMKYQPEVIRLLLQYGIDKMLLCCIDEEGNNIVNIGCKYNSKSLEYLLNSNYDLTMLFNNKPHPIFYATKYNPDAVKCILESKYGSTYIFYETFEGNSCLNMALSCQPKSLCYMLKSKHMTSDILNMENDSGYSILADIKCIYRNISCIPDIYKLELVNNINIIANNDDPNMCNICYEFKKCAILVPCAHTICVGCAFRVNRCPMCKADIQKKSFIF